MNARRDEYEVDPDTGLVRVSPRAGLLQRSAATSDHEAALSKLHRKLAVSTVLLERHEDGRIAVFGAINELMDYLESQGIPRAAMSALQTVSAAILDADRGATHQIFKGDAKPGAPPKPVLQTNFEEQLAVVTECCVRHLKKQEARPYLNPAAKMAAALVNQSSLGVITTPTQMRELRERVRQLAIGTFGRQTYDLLLASPFAQDEPLAYAKAWLESDHVTPPK